MSALSDAINQRLRFPDHACQIGVEALTQLVQARLALFTADQAGVSEIQRKELRERFAQQQALTREAMKPLVGLSPDTVGETYFEEKWEKPLRDMGHAFKNAFGRSPDQKNEVSGFRLHQLLAPDYAPHATDVMADIAFNTLPVYEPALGARSHPQTTFNFERFSRNEATQPLTTTPTRPQMRGRTLHG